MLFSVRLKSSLQNVIWISGEVKKCQRSKRHQSVFWDTAGWEHLPVRFQWHLSVLEVPVVSQCVLIMQMNSELPLEENWVTVSARVVPVKSVQCYPVFQWSSNLLHLCKFTLDYHCELQIMRISVKCNYIIHIFMYVLTRYTATTKAETKSAKCNLANNQPRVHSEPTS